MDTVLFVDALSCILLFQWHACFGRLQHDISSSSIATIVLAFVQDCSSHLSLQHLQAKCIQQLPQLSLSLKLSLSLSQSLSIKLSIPLSLRPFPPIRPSPESELCPGKSHGMAKLANGRGLMDKCSAMSPCKPLRLTKSDDVQCPESKGSNMIQCITSMFGNGLCSCKRPWPFIDSSASHPATAHGLRQPSPKRNKVAPKHQEPIPLVCLATGLHLACVHCTNLPHNLH